MHRSGIKTVYGCSVIVNVSFVYKMYFYSPGLCFFIVLPRFFQIFSIFLFIFISKRHNPWDILFFIFSPVFLFSGGFSLIFLFYRPSCTFSVFYRFIWFHYNFSVFMVLIFFSRSHVFYPLFHLSGLPFSFFVNNLTFSLLSTFFISSLRFLSLIAISHHFLAFHCLSLPFTASPSRFYSFRPCLYYIFPFSVVFCLFSTHFYLFCFFRLFHRFTPSFCHFFRSSFIFSFCLCHSPRLIFHVSRLSKCFTWNIVFYVFRSSAINEKRFASRLSENHSHFSPLLFLKQSYFLFYFWFSRLFYIFPVFLRVSRSFSSLLSLFY